MIVGSRIRGAISSGLIAGVTLGLAGCGTASPTPPEGGNSNPPSGLTVAPDGRLIAELEVNTADGIVALGDSIYVKTDDGHVVAIDVVDNEIVGDARVDTATDEATYCAGIGTDGTAVWSCSASDDGTNLVRLDPATLDVLETFEVDKIFDQLTLPFAAGSMWVLSGTGDQLVGVDAATSMISPPIPLGVRCQQLAAMGDDLVASCVSDDLVLRIDPDAQEVAARATIASPGIIAASGNSVWVGSGADLVRLDPESLEVAATVAGLAPGPEGDIAIADDEVWVRRADSFLVQVDPAANEPAQTITTEPQLSGGSAVIVDDTIWTTAFNNHRVLRIATSE